MMDSLCGCGLRAKYFKIVDGGIEEESCNKYGRCPTYDELKASLNVAERKVSYYELTLKKIKKREHGDSFQYRAWAQNALELCNGE